MEPRNALKRRLLAEAVRLNAEGPRRPASGLAIRLTRVPALPLLVASVFLIGSLVYLSLPSNLVPPARVAAATPRATASSDAPTRGDHEGAREDVPPAAPTRLARGVLALAVKRIVLDPGHGGAQHGTMSDSGVAEKEITLDVARRLARLLTEASFEVLLTRQTDATVSLEERSAFANAHRADLFVSIHVNWIPRRDVRPIETYYAGPTDDPASLRLARAENRDSGYSLAAYRDLLEKLYVDTRRDESRALARAVNAELYRSLGAVNPVIENRGVKTAPFAVLIGTEMPAILVEVSCLSNAAEASLLASGDYRESIAVALLRGIRSYTKDLDSSGKKES